MKIDREQISKDKERHMEVLMMVVTLCAACYGLLAGPAFSISFIIGGAMCGSPSHLKIGLISLGLTVLCLIWVFLYRYTDVFCHTSTQRVNEK